MGIKLKLIAGALAFGAFATAYAADPIKIGVDGPFTGGSSSMGVSMRDGVRLATDEINKAGGVLGRQIVLVERDDEAKNERGVQIAQELINKEKVVAVVGYINTGVALASQRFFQEAKIPVMNNVATGTIITQQFDDQPDNYVFRNSANDRIQAPMIVEEAVTQPRLQEGRDPRRLDQLRPARPRRPRKGAVGEGRQAGRRREVQHQGRRHDGPVAEGQGSRRRSRADLRHRPGARADRQRHDQARLEGAADRQLDACRWRTTSTTPAPTAKARACRRPSSRKRPRRSARPSSTAYLKDVQAEERPHRLAGVGGAGLRLGLPARRRDQAGRLAPTARRSRPRWRT